MTPLPRAEARLAGDFSLRLCLEVLFRRRRVFLVPVILTPLFSLLLTLVLPPSYMSTTTILLGRQEILNPLVRYETAVTMADWNRLSPFQKIVYSRPLIEDVIREVHLDKDVRNERDLERLVTRVRANIHIIGLQTDFFQISCTAPDPLLAKRMVETVSRLFIEKSLQGSRREATAAVNFIQTATEQYRQELDRLEKTLQEFRQEHAETLKLNLTLGDQLREYGGKGLEAELDLKQERLNEQLLAERLVGEKPMVVAQAVYVQNTVYQRQSQELALRMANLLATRDRSHPEVQKLQREMDQIAELLAAEKQKNEASERQEVRSTVHQELKSRLDDARLKVRVLEQKVADYQRWQEQARTRLRAIPGLDQQQARLEGEVKLTREIHDSLRLKLEQAKVAQNVEIEQQASRFTIIDPPRVPADRYKPSLRLFAAAGVAGGIGVGLLLTFLLEFADPRLIRPDEVTRRLGIPLLGVLPKLSRGRRRNWLLRACRRAFRARRFELPASFSPDLVLTAAEVQRSGVATDPHERHLREFVERLRFIGLSLSPTTAAAGTRVWLIASARAGEGKSLLAANLGVTLATDLLRPVLLLDANPAHPTLSTLFGHRDATGLGELIEGRLSLGAALCATSTPNLSLLPVGHTTLHPAAQYREAVVAHLLAQLRERFALILIDTPSLGAHAEGLLLAPHSDGVVLVSRLYDTKKKAIEAAALQLPRPKLVGAVANGDEYWLTDWLYRWV